MTKEPNRKPIVVSADDADAIGHVENGSFDLPKGTRVMLFEKDTQYTKKLGKLQPEHYWACPIILGQGMLQNASQIEMCNVTIL